MASRRRIFVSRRQRFWPWLVGATVGFAVLGATYQWLGNDPIPACSAERVRSEIETLVMGEHMSAPATSGAPKVRVGRVREVEVQAIESRIHARICSAVAVVDDQRYQFRFRIVTDPTTNSYRIGALQN